MKSNRQKLFNVVLSIESQLSLQVGSNLIPGLNGLVPFYDCLYKVTGRKKFLVKRTLAVLSSKRYLQSSSAISFCGGLTGAAWTLALNAKACRKSESLLNHSLDSKIYIESLRKVADHQYSFIDGGGLAIAYALIRLPDKFAKGYLRQVIGIVDRSMIITNCNKILSSSSTTQADKESWIKRLTLVACILMRIENSADFKTSASQLLTKCFGVFINNNQVLNYVENMPHSKTETVWESGPLPILVTLNSLAMHVGHERAKKTILRLCAKHAKLLLRNRQDDPSFVTGCSGLAYILKGLHVQSGVSEFQAMHKLALSLLNNTLAESFKNFMYKTDMNCFLTGPAGLGFVLLDSLGSANRDWSSCVANNFDTDF